MSTIDDRSLDRRNSDKQFDYSSFIGDNYTQLNYTSSPLPFPSDIEMKAQQDQSDNYTLNGKSVNLSEVPRKRPLEYSASESLVLENEEVVPKRIKIEKEYDQIMFGIFQPWVLKTYGDLAKTKTITLKKQFRIMKALQGKEMNNPDSSKFRFWVKSKGFTTVKPKEFKDIYVAIEMDRNDDVCKLYIPNNLDSGGGATGHINSGSVSAGGSNTIGQTYRKVAVVEHFYNIIYDVHISLGSKSGRHAGQKRTYRTITEYYAFLPREAVTKFLSLCNDCKKIRRTYSPSHLIIEDSITESSSECDKNKLEFNLKKELLRLTTTTKTGVGGGGKSITPSENTSIIDWEEKISMDQKQQSILEGLNHLPQHPQHPQQQQQQQQQQQSQPSTNIFADNYFTEIYSKLFEYYNTQNNNNVNNINNNNNTNTNTNTNNNTNISNGNSTPPDDANNKNLQISNDVMIYYQLLKQFYENSSEQNAAGDEGRNSLQFITENLNLKKNLSLNMGSLYETLKQKEAMDYLPGAQTDVSKLLLNTNDPSKSPEPKNTSKTTPPKKRYSTYSEEIRANMLADLPKLPLPFVNKMDFQTPATISGTQMNNSESRLQPSNTQLIATADDELNLNASDKENDINSSVNNHNGSKLLSSNVISSVSSTSSGSVSGNIVPGSGGSVVNCTSNYYKKLGAPEIKPITSTYLELTRSMGLSDDDALNLDSISSSTSDGPQENNISIEDAYAEQSLTLSSNNSLSGLVKDADKLKLMLLAWNYQNSAAVRNGTEGPDLATMGGLWAQYQNAITLGNKQGFPMTGNMEQNCLQSPIENQDETNSSEHKDDDDVSEDESDDRPEPIATDPERLKAFNMFVRLFVDENLDRMIPISKQPKEKIQAIIDSCTRQFPEFSERARKRLRTYLKSCRRNKKAREGWENTTRPTPAHLTSVQAEQILALACENESMNAKRMRIGLEPISQGVQSQNTTNGDTILSSSLFPGLQSKIDSDTHTSALSIATNVPKSSPNAVANDLNIMRSMTNATNLLTTTTNSSNQQPYNNDLSFAVKAQQYQGFLSNQNAGNAPTPTSSTTVPTSTITTTTGPTDLSLKRPPLISHKLNPNEITAVKQLVTGYRESAAFLMRSADELEHLLLQQP